MTALLETYVSEVLNEVLRGFNLRDFKALRTIDDRIDYAGRILPHMGTGSSRIVFALSGGKVLKIARNKKGIAQNQAEIDVFMKMDQAGLGQFVTTIFDYDPKNTWVLSEIAKPLPDYDVGEERFEEISGVPWPTFDSFAHRMKASGSTFAGVYHAMKSHIESEIRYYKRREDHGDLRPEDANHLAYNQSRLETLEKAVKANPKLLKALEFLMNKMKMALGDIIQVEHWGTTIDDRLVLVDYGATSEIIQKYYTAR